MSHVVPAAAAVLTVATVASASPFASAWLDYVPGSGANPDFIDPAAALGSPTRFSTTAFGSYAVAPFQPAGGIGEVVTLGAGGSLTLRLGTTARDDAANPFGIDLLVFGNAFFFADDFNSPNPTATALFSEGGTIELSADGLAWTTVIGAAADGGLPTRGYADQAEPFPAAPGTIETDFTMPVDPSFDPIGRTLAEINAAYGTSGGGLGIDLGAIGMSEASFIRFTNPLGSALTPEIDAVSVVPAPAGVLVVLGAAVRTAHRRRR